LSNHHTRALRLTFAMQPPRGYDPCHLFVFDTSYTTSRPPSSYSFLNATKNGRGEEFPFLLNVFQHSQSGPISFRRKRRGFDRPLSSLSLSKRRNEEGSPSSSSDAMQRGLEEGYLIFRHNATRRGSLLVSVVTFLLARVFMPWSY
jgi:hypothetical protein